VALDIGDLRVRHSQVRRLNLGRRSGGATGRKPAVVDGADPVQRRILRRYLRPRNLELTAES
jgi:hypothetical protein